MMRLKRAVGGIALRDRRLAVVATLVLLAGAIALLVFPNTVVMVTGKTATPRLSAPDQLPAAGRDDPTPFLIERNTVVVETDAAMSVRELLDLYRLQRPDLRRQVLEHLGNPSLDSTVAAGTRFTLTLTPTAGDVPGTGAARTTS
jgi:hypothetical protein